MRRYTKPTFLISKATLPSLLKKRNEITNEIVSLKEDITITNISEKIREVEKLEQKVKENDSKIYSLRQQRRPKSGLLNRLLLEDEVQPVAQEQINVIEIEQRTLRSKINSLSEGKLRSQSYKLSVISSKEEFLQKIEKRIQYFEDKKQKLESLKNKAAKVTKEKRQIGDVVKRRIPKNDDCPYCGELILDTPHADHIYPVSKGGESVTRNMVYVCSSCNLKKKNMTLTMFIKKFSLDRDEIEKRLDELKKDY